MPDDTGNGQRFIALLRAQVIIPKMSALEEHHDMAAIPHIAAVEGGVINARVRIAGRPGHREIRSLVVDVVGQDG